MRYKICHRKYAGVHGTLRSITSHARESFTNPFRELCARLTDKLDVTKARNGEWGMGNGE